MSVFICKLNNFIFYRRTISGPRSFYDSRINRRTIQIIPDDVMCFLICISKKTGNLINLYIFFSGRKGKRNYFLITKLFFHFRKINRTFIHPCRRSRFKSAHLNTKAFQRICQMISRLQSVGSRIGNCLTAKTSGI